MSQTGHARRRRKALEAQMAAEAEQSQKDLSSMKVDELKKLAEEAQIDGFETMKKAELIAALEAKQTETE